MKRFIPFVMVAFLAVPSLLQAASSQGCVDGGFALLGLAGDQDTIVPASSVPASFLVKGKYIEFTVDAATLGVRDWTLTGAPSDLDITGGRRTMVFASKMPDHRGLTLTSGVTVKMSRGSLVLSRVGAGLSMKIQVKDCANGGVFQMEVARDDQNATVFTHILADGVFYFDNPNVRNRLGENIPCSGVLSDGTPVVCNGANADGTVTVTARVNFGNDLSDKFVGRDSPQVATRIGNGCPNNIPNPFHPGSVNHCGGTSQWSVASGGRMGQVMGEDSTEIAPAATKCTENCTAQNQVNGKAVVVGFPFPVPNAVRLQPRFVAPPPLKMSAVVSRKTQGSVLFDINLPLTGAVGIESRSGGGNHTLVFTFNNNLVSGSASVTSGVGTLSTSSIGPNPNQFTVNLTGVANQQYLTVALNNVADSQNSIGNFSATMGVLLGDTTGNGFVNSADVSQTQSQSGQSPSGSNFREDVTGNGFINSADVSLVQSQSGTSLP